MTTQPTEAEFAEIERRGADRRASVAAEQAPYATAAEVAASFCAAPDFWCLLPRRQGRWQWCVLL